MLRYARNDELLNTLALCKEVNSMKKGYLLILLALIICLSLAACAAPSQAPASAPSAKPAATSAAGTPQYGGVLKIIRRDGPSQMGAQTDDQAVNQHYGLPAFDPLAWFDELGQPELGPGRVLTAVNIAPEGKSVTLTLRKGVKFHDGTDFNAEALKYNYANIPTSRRSFLQSVTSMDVIDDYTFRFNLSKFDVVLLENLPMGSGYIASPTAAKKPTTTENIAKDHCIGTGPFKVVSWQRDISVKYEKFSGYWDQGKPYLDGIEITGVVDPVTALMSFESGGGDILIDVAPDDAVRLKAKGFRIVSLKGLGPGLIPDGANADSPFANKLVRMALEYALDRQTLAKELGYGFYEPAYQICYALLGYNPDIEGRKYDPVKAKQLLSEAGYPKGFKTSLIFPTVKSVGGRINQNEVVAIQTYLREVGIEAELDMADTARFTSLGQNGWRGIMCGDALAGPAVVGVAQRRLDKAAPANRSIFRPAGFQETFDAARSEPNLAQRQASVKKMTRIMYDEVMIVPLWQKSNIVAMKQSVQGSKYMETNYEYLWYPGGAWLSK